MSEPDTQTQRLKWRAAFRARRALIPSQFGMGRPDRKSWVARVLGTSQRFGLDRQFLRQVYPIVYAKRPVIAFDCDVVREGDVLEVRGHNSRTAPFSAFYYVQSVDDEGINLVLLNGQEVADYAQGKGEHDDSTSIASP